MAGVQFLESSNNLTVGRWSYGKPKILGALPVTIGSFCSIADGVIINAGVDHRVDWISTYPFSSKHLRQYFPRASRISGHPTGKGPVIIGSDVWIGYNSLIMSGVHIGHGAVIAAGSVVTGHVPHYTIVGGNPAREIRRRVNKAAEILLLEMKWWDWPEKHIQIAVPWLCGHNLGWLEEYWNENIRTTAP